MGLVYGNLTFIGSGSDRTGNGTNFLEMLFEVWAFAHLGYTLYFRTVCRICAKGNSNTSVQCVGYVAGLVVTLPYSV